MLKERKVKADIIHEGERVNEAVLTLRCCVERKQGQMVFLNVDSSSFFFLLLEERIEDHRWH